MQTGVSEREDTESLGRELDRNGVISIEGYLDDETCNEIREEVKKRIDNDDFEEADDETDKRGSSRTLLKRRTGKYDDGMINIFNIDETIPRIKEIKHDDLIGEIVETAGGQDFEPQNVNIYYNKSVTNTRGYHFDSYHQKYKSFVYLTDVPDESHGPYSYVKGTNNRSYPRRRVVGLLNKLRGEKSTNAIQYDDDDVVTFTAPKGTLIISDQTGYHRGIPQEEGKERMLISNSHIR